MSEQIPKTTSPDNVQAAKEKSLAEAPKFRGMGQITVLRPHTHTHENKMKIKEHINEIINLIASSIIEGDYEVVQFSDHSIKIEIDELQFEIWTCNGPEYLNFWDVTGMFGEAFGDESTRKKIWDSLEPHIQLHRSTSLKDEKIAAIAKLQAEVAELTK